MLQRVINEPVVLGGAIRAIILAAVSFGLNWTGEQVAQLMFAVEAVLAVITRASVTPNQLANERVAKGQSPTKSGND